MASIATLQNVLKYDYLGPIQSQLNNDQYIYSLIKKSSKEVVGEQVVLPLHVGRNWGVGARGTTGTATLPTARSQQYNKATFATKDIYGRIEIYGKAIRATRSDKGAFLRAVQSEIKGAVTDMGNMLCRMMHGDGSGTLTTISSGATSATQTVASTQYLEEGMYVDIGGDTGCLISSINSATSITLSASITTSTSDTVVITGTSSTDELNGLDLITDNAGSLQGIDPSTYSWWKGVVFGDDTSPVALDEADMQSTLDQIEINGGKVGAIITSYGGRNAYRNLLVSLKRFTDSKVVELKGGYKGSITFNEIPVMADRFCKKTSTTTRFYFLDLESLGIYRMAEFDWMQEDGNVMARQVGSGAKEAYEATLVSDMEFATTARKHNGRLEGVVPA